MQGYKKLIIDLAEKNEDYIQKNIGDYDIYESSLQSRAGSWFFMAHHKEEKKLFIVNESSCFDQFRGQEKKIAGSKVKMVSLNHENAEILREFFPFTAPDTIGRQGVSLGLGDRLGLASPGHIDTVRDKNITPVLAQQSIRELDLTERTYEDVLDAASWAVFQENYQDGFGADGDHLKSEEEVNMALDIGFTMITLDGSEHIDNSIEQLDSQQISKKYDDLISQKEAVGELEKMYLGNSFALPGGQQIKFSREQFQKIVLIYFELLNFAEEIYRRTIALLDRDIDFELSIDETATPTSPEAHYFTASELDRRGLQINSLAPRFCGEFQKAIDYIGDLDRFESEFQVHAEIAEEFGYKLSIHSGSDKFSVYPIIGRYTDQRVHVKTAGTNWLEAIWIIAENDPELYRELHKYARNNFAEATQYYHVTTDLDQIPSVEQLSDRELLDLQNNEDARQLIHITYGVILTARKEDGSYLFRDRLYKFWREHEEEYRRALQQHIGRHIEELGLA